MPPDQRMDELAQLEQMHSLGALSSGVAHHFNNLLSVILGYASFILNREDHSEDTAKALQKICEAAQEGRRMTDDLLAFGGDEEQSRSCYVHDIIKSVLTLLQSQTSSHVEVSCQFEAHNDQVFAPPGSIHQIIFNLLTNAIDSMPDEGTLTVATANTVMDGDNGSQTYLRLQVSDSSGITPEGIEASADDTSIDDDFQPRDYLGLRLSSISGIVGQLDGVMVISSEPESLTTVTALLPIATGPVHVAPRGKEAAGPAPGVIWVVDDDERFCEMCTQVFTQEGHEVNTMDGGRAFQQQWQKTAPPDLIIMDFSMPEFTGLELCEWLSEQGAEIPVILVSGLSSDHPDIRKALAMKRVFFLEKPFSFREITDVISMAMGETLITG